MKPATLLDHLVVTAPDLATGVRWVRDKLGANPQPGGKHLRMGTHNCLLALGAQTYLEIISPDPAAPPPGRPRWFQLDALAVDAQPRLAAWVARTTDIEATMRASSEPLGRVEPMTRDELQWLITVTPDGGLPLDGMAPILIQWQTTQHPALAMRDSGWRIQCLELHHPDHERIDAVLRSIGYAGNGIELKVDSAASPRLVAVCRGPDGRTVALSD